MRLIKPRAYKKPCTAYLYTTRISLQITIYTLSLSTYGTQTQGTVGEAAAGGLVIMKQQSFFAPPFFFFSLSFCHHTPPVKIYSGSALNGRINVYFDPTQKVPLNSASTDAHHKAFVCLASVPVQ